MEQPQELDSLVTFTHTARGKSAFRSLTLSLCHGRARARIIER